MADKTKMRFKRVKCFTEILLAFIGVGMLVIAFYAYELKLDNNPTMGYQRKSLALMGVACLVLAAGTLASNRIRALNKTHVVQHTALRFESALDWVCRSSLLKWFSYNSQRARASKLGRLILRHPEVSAIGGALLVILISYWYITSGLWVWSAYSRYFDRQADAFLAGSLALLEKPSAQLLTLANPYNYHNRVGINYLWDASLYQNKFYLYWGPVPAILAAAVKLIHPGNVEDQYLLMFFIVGLAVVLAALLHWLRKTFFPKTPIWTVMLLTMIGGLSTPVLWLVSRPSVYETAIAGGNFFLLLGIYAALRGMAVWRANGWLAVAGMAWGASVGCRLNNAFAVFWLAALTCLFLFFRAKKTWIWFFSAICLGVPLLAWATGLGWYNLARFGSVFETGHRYQLTGPALPEDYSLVISTRYIAPNLYNYLFRPLTYSWKEFPFVFAPNIKEWMWPRFVWPPEHYYYSEPVAGIFLSIPFFWLVILPILRPLRAGWNWANERSTEPVEPAHPLFSWVWWMIAGATLLNLSSLLVFISSTMRYLADIAPLMTILSGLCAWWGLGFLHQRQKLHRLLLAFVVISGLVSLWIGLFINFHVGKQRFETNNPDLYQAIAHFFLGNH